MARTPRGKSPEPHTPSIPPQLALKKLERLLEQIPDVRSQGRRSAAFSTWEGNVKIVLGEFYGQDSIPFEEFRRIYFHPGAIYRGQPESDFVKAFMSGLDEAIGFLESRIEDLRDMVGTTGPGSVLSTFTPDPNSRKVFVVHGSDHGQKETVARFLQKLDLEPIILHEQPDRGKTIIEKFESHSEGVQCAVVILTGDDVAHSKASPAEEEQRARQNVILELGFFLGSLGRRRTFALVAEDVTLPSDVHGVLYIPLDAAGHWRLILVRELNAAGIKADANLAL